MDTTAFFKITYGLYLLSAHEDGNDNACVVNTVMQVTDTPPQVAVVVNKNNLTHDMISRTGFFAVSILTQEAKFDLFKSFGYQSGHDIEKLGEHNLPRDLNGVVYFPEESNATLSGKVISQTDLGTHTMFIASVSDAQVLSDKPSLNYEFYHKNVKPAPKQDSVTTGYRCQICNYVYEGEVLPDDFICPLCKHGVNDFVKIEAPAPKPTGYRCRICNYVYEGDILPDDFICPLCKHGASDFEKL